jgi:serine protease Do
MRSFTIKLKSAITIAVVILPLIGFSQSRQAKQLEMKIKQAVNAARPASVRMWGFDTLLNKRNSGQFSGVVVKEGYILTAAHVSEPGNTYKVMFPDGRECIAKALGKIEFAEDKTRPDVALMKIVTGGTWPCAEIGDSENLRPLEPCISIAYPESLNQSQPTVRFGHVTVPHVERGFIKSTCMMEPGDSGGPLFDVEGRVIGLHSAIEVPEYDNYDVPVHLYKKYWTALQQTITYHALPEKTDTFSPAVAGHKALPGLARMTDFVGVSKKNQRNCVKVVSIFNGKPEKINGILISLSGESQLSTGNGSLIVSKSSMVGDTGLFVLYGSKRARATVIARDNSTDLVLLQLLYRIPGGIKIGDIKRRQLPDIPEGSILISPQPDTTAITSVLGSPRFDLPRISSLAFSGATPLHGSKPAKVYFVRPGSQAAASGMRPGDVITNINNIPIDDAEDFLHEMLKFWPGDTVIFQYKREGTGMQCRILLSYPPQIKYNHPAEFFAGGKSIRRDGFIGVYVNDAILRPDQCGGPVFDLNGNFCGMNIARFSRANSVLLTTDHIVEIINKHFNPDGHQ